MLFIIIIIKRYIVHTGWYAFNANNLTAQDLWTF